ncbi:MAG: phenylalanine--tRNA ligase subunit beta [Peptostreptococcaceae bacterium]|nr:phenylalanine--tRNA ligase subunit beta [Peptostreptococcaceae bacterium]
MRVSLNWLKDYTDINIEPKKYADLMTMSGTKVETIEYVGDELENIIIGQILEILPHPDAEKLVITKVNVGQQESLQIVTGANNISVGDIIPVAVEGAKLPNGVKIKKGKLRGVDSFGMLCSCEELGIDSKYVEEKSQNGIYILNDEFKVGDNAIEAMGLRDVIIEFELTANRPDCRAFIGIAKETAATLDTGFRLPSKEISKATEGKVSVAVEVEDKALCPRFMAKEIRNVKIQPSPFWLRQRLISYGLRPINNIVDITNYVMIEYGQPLHAYDLNKLTTKKIVVRRAKDGEQITTLDDKEYKLDKDALLITDGEKPIGIAGVMGGANTEVDENTSAILLEAANFDADSVRLTSRRLGIRTDASSAFEKGIDILRPQDAIERACHLIEMIGAGEIVNDTVDVYANDFQNTVIQTKISYINRILGEEIPASSIESILKKLLFEVTIEGDDLQLIVPPERMDMTIREDIVEEIARIYGYNNISSKPIYASVTQAHKSPERKFEDRIKQLSRSNGLTEITTYSFVSPMTLEKSKIQGEKYHKLLRLLNPLGEETSVMRTTLMPSMLEVISLNLARKNEALTAFEYGNTFFDEGGELPNEKKSMVAGIYGDGEDFFTAKARLEGILNGIGIHDALYQTQSENAMYHPTRCADVYVQDRLVATIGEVNPFVLEEFDIKKRVYVFELYIQELMASSDLNVHYHPIPKYPAIAKDIALVVNKSKQVGELANIIKKYGKKNLESVELFDIYEGEQVGENKKSVAFALVFRAKDRTLTDEEINKVLEKILTQLKEEADAVLR